eukprot:m.16255 g.16255  ORF g.16255 m.16255 type:complete len:368 (+) comp5196_c0_seq1:243-1346(+)
MTALVRALCMARGAAVTQRLLPVLPAAGSVTSRCCYHTRLDLGTSNRNAGSSNSINNPSSNTHNRPQRSLATLTGAHPLHKEGATHFDLDSLELPQVIDGSGSLAVIFGGFGFKEKQMKKHQELYELHGFDTMPMFSSITDLTTPATASVRGRRFATEIIERDQDFALHLISGSFWTALITLEQIGLQDPTFLERRLKAIVFDSCPPKSDIFAFGGWFCYAFKLDPKTWQPIVSQFFRPYRWARGITAQFEHENDVRMKTVIPKGVHTLFMHGRNDPVLDTEYVTEYANFLRGHTGAFSVELLFDRSRHSMGIVDFPQLYKSCHVNRLLAHVPQWNQATDETGTPIVSDATASTLNSQEEPRLAASG